MPTPLGIGVVGCGSVLAAYAPVIERLDYRAQARLVMACDRDETKRSQMAEQHHVQAFTTDYRELIDSPQVDIVLILTSMLEHARIAKAALLAGKHVLVEKPMATDLDEAAELLELAKQGPGLYFPAPFVSLSPTFQSMARHIQRGDIGVPLSARARYGWSGPWWGKWFYQSGGGAIFDLAPYNLTSLTGLLGPARRVAAMTGVAIPERQAGGENLQRPGRRQRPDFDRFRRSDICSGYSRVHHPAIPLSGVGSVRQPGHASRCWAMTGIRKVMNCGRMKWEPGRCSRKPIRTGPGVTG